MNAPDTSALRHPPTETAVMQDKNMARDFLGCLDLDAGRFTFQFFGDGAESYAEIRSRRDGLGARS